MSAPEPVVLDWSTGNGWRVIGAEYWPQLQKPRRPGDRPVVVPPLKPAPLCRLCRTPAHLLDDNRHPVHKTCLEAELTAARYGQEESR